MQSIRGYISVALVMFVFIVGGQVRAQIETRNPELTRLHYEQGLMYTDPIGRTFSPCDADDYSVTIDWHDRAEVGTKVGAPNASGITTKGEYPFTSNHVFTQTGDYKVSVKNYAVHCRKATSTFTIGPATYTVHVHPRVPVKNLDPDVSLPLHPGNTARFRITLDKPAPASGTRVALTVDNASIVKDLKPEVDVPAGAQEARFSFAIVSSLPKSTTLVVTATAGGASVSQKVTVVTP